MMPIRGAVARHRRLFRHPSRRSGRRQILSDPQSQEFLLMTWWLPWGRCLFAVHRHGHSHHLRLLHEKGCLHRKFHPNVRNFRYGHCHHGRPDDHPRGVRLLRRRSDALKAGPSLMFITIPKVSIPWAWARHRHPLLPAGAVCRADQLHRADRKRRLHLARRAGLEPQQIYRHHGRLHGRPGQPVQSGYGPLANVTILGMQFLDFFDFLTNSVMMPIAAIASCILVSRVIGVDRIAEEVTLNGGTFRRRKIFNVMIRFHVPLSSPQSFSSAPSPTPLAGSPCK